MATLNNIETKKYRMFLIQIGCKKTRTSGGHEHWTRKDLSRPITFQSHFKTIPMFIVKQHLRHLGLSSEEFLDLYK
jgi:hypothetical protein